MNDRSRITITRLVTGSLLFFLALRLAEHATLSALGTPPLFTVDLDVTYWLYKLSGFPDWLMRHRAATIVFDSCLFSSGVLAFIRPLDRRIMLVFATLSFVYALTFDLFATHHLAQVVGFMIVLLPFLAGSNLSFTLAWEGMRYFTCLIYFLAFLWKTCFNDSFYYLHQGVSSFKYNLVDYIALNPGTTMTALYKWFLQHSWLLDAGEKSLVLLEGFMVIGLFTKKHDRWLIWGPVVIHLLTYFFSDVFFIELLVIDLSFLSVSQLNRLADIFARPGDHGDGLLPRRTRKAKKGDTTPLKR